MSLKEIKEMLSTPNGKVWNWEECVLYGREAGGNR